MRSVTVIPNWQGRPQASGAVRRFGICLLPGLVEHLNPLQGWESLELEAALAEALREGGIDWVEGGH